LLNRRKRIRKPYLRSAVKDSFNMAITGVVALAASWTWFLAKGHMSTHLHQDGMMYMYPFAIVYYIFFGYLMQTVLDILFSGPVVESDGGQVPVPSGLQEVNTD
ncbi:MAG: hypothetical protein JXA25_04930, partial [Anaerolineales bacterium]|nr:hypothetical protein [Anaerolineales bacterium]